MFEICAVSLLHTCYVCGSLLSLSARNILPAFSPVACKFFIALKLSGSPAGDWTPSATLAEISSRHMKYTVKISVDFTVK